MSTKKPIYFIGDAAINARIEIDADADTISLIVVDPAVKVSMDRLKWRSILRWVEKQISPPSIKGILDDISFSVAEATRLKMESVKLSDAARHSEERADRLTDELKEIFEENAKPDPASAPLTGRFVGDVPNHCVFPQESGIKISDLDAEIAAKAAAKAKKCFMRGCDNEATEPCTFGGVNLGPSCKTHANIAQPLLPF